MRRRLPASPLGVWAVEDTSVQLTWGALPPGQVTAWAGDVHQSCDHPGGPGSLTIEGLASGTKHRIDVTWSGGRKQLETATLAPPPGQELCRVATVSDLHLGSRRWGAAKTMVDRSQSEIPFPMRCARASVAEAVAWGADLLLVKGDAAHHQDRDHFRQVGDLLDGVDIPTMLIPGNHEVDGRGDQAHLPATVGERGIPYITTAASHDLPGLRIIAANTAVQDKGHGSIDAVAAEIVELAAVSPGPFLLGLHHHLQARPQPTSYPPGVAGPGSTDLLDALATANSSGFVTSGHTHRNRARHHGPFPLTEVASTRDWPGVWAGYVVHEGGIRQVVRRAAAQEAISWHEYSRLALFGWWEHWSKGPLEQRCFSHRWPR